MTSYSSTDKQRLLSIPIRDILAVFGKRTDRSRSGLFFSPFREEKDPSFRVFSDSNVWHDFGTGESGGVIALVSRLKGCSESDAWDFLAGLSTACIEPVRPVVDSTTAARRTSSAVTIDRLTSGVKKASLKEYICSTRCIPEQIVSRYCFEACYHTSRDRSRSFTAIAFPNNSGGYVLRSPSAKICTKSDITTVGTDGVFTRDVSSGKAIVFEGFMDFLSWIALCELVNPSMDVCVLNSTVNWRKAEPWLLLHSEIFFCLDNDNAGRGVLSDMAGSLGKSSPDIVLRDCSSMYGDSKDFNEYLMTQHSTEIINL